MNDVGMKKVFQGEIFSIWQWEQEMYDGSKKIFENIGRASSANAIGVLPDKTIMLIWDEQPGRETEGVLTPAGGQIDAGETPEQGAKREFFEETGYVAKSVIPWFSYTPSSKIMFTIHFFIAKDIQKKAEPQQTTGERSTIKLFSFEEFLTLGHNEQLRDMRLRIMLLEAQLDPVKKENLYNLLYA